MVSVKVCIECIETGESVETEGLHENGYAAWTNAANAAWEAFGNPSDFGYGYRVKPGGVVAHTEPLEAFSAKVAARR